MQRELKYNGRRGFTLIEILIVVVILGVLSSIVIPQFTNATEDAEETSARAQLNILRGQMSMYWVTYGTTASIGSNVEEVVDVLDGAGLLTAPLLDPDQTDNNSIQLSGDYTVSWNRVERQFLVSKDGTPTNW